MSNCQQHFETLPQGKQGYLPPCECPRQAPSCIQPPKRWLSPLPLKGSPEDQQHGHRRIQLTPCQSKFWSMAFTGSSPFSQPVTSCRHPSPRLHPITPSAGHHQTSSTAREEQPSSTSFHPGHESYRPELHFKCITAAFLQVPV